MHFLFPTDPLDPRRIDEYFDLQRSAGRTLGHTTSLVPDDVFNAKEALRGVPPNANVAYRGWMVTAPQYQALTEAVAAAHSRPLTPLAEYLATHHLPRWYPLLADFTPLTRVFPENADLVAELTELGWSRFFVKHYVKSLKTSVGSIISDPPEITHVLHEMRRFRGEIEGGICVRQFEPLVPDSECRYFVLNGQAFAPEEQCTIPQVVLIAAERIASPFFSVDVAQRTDLEIRIIELGDGQVSDLVGWSIESFSRMWRIAGAA